VFVSFPPDLEVNRPACQVWDNQSSSNTTQALPPAQAVKLDSIYAAGGPKCLTDTVQQLTGLRFNHFVGVDFSGFRDLVNGVQGVSLCVKAPIKDGTLGTIVGQAGQVTLSGDQALNFVRAAQVTGQGSQPPDLLRINRQQRFLAAFLRKTVGQQNLLMDQNLLNTFLGSFAQSTFGDNMGVDQLSKLAVGLQSLSLGRVTFVTVPTANTLDQAGNETLVPDTAKQLFTAIIDNSPLPGETAGQSGSSQPAPSSVSPQGIKVQVLNAVPNATRPLAGETATKLRGFGFNVNSVGGTPPNVTQTVIKYSADQAAQAKLVASSVPSATLQVDPSQDGAIQLILGPGFDENVVAPNANSAAGAAATSEAPSGLAYLNATDTSCA
jgi:LCP family protein required for cell wall assembly